MITILVADDEPSIRLTVSDTLRNAGYEVTTASDGAEAAAVVKKGGFDVLISDIRMPKLDGLALFDEVKRSAPDCQVILMTAYGEVADAVQAMRDGAADYVTKPFDPEEMVARVQRLAERAELRRELREARAALERQGAGTPIVGQSAPMQALKKRVETVAKSDAPVVVTGESGTGKELVARALHGGSSRVERAFVAVNCAAFPETLIEAELFGHERGAFTGAVRRRDGRFKAADGGTLFLDEIGEIPLLVQAKLLRVLQDGQIEPLGTNTAVKVDVRLICATHRNLKQLIAAGKFREDLYYRLNVLDIHVPALRERRDDIPLLIEHFLRRFGRRDEKTRAIAPRAWSALLEYAYPGNVRELEHALRHAVALAGDTEIDLEHLPRDIVGSATVTTGDAPAKFRALADAAKEFERAYLLRALSLAGAKRAEAAALLGISRKNLWEKLKAHGITDEDVEE